MLKPFSIICETFTCLYNPFVGFFFLTFADPHIYLIRSHEYIIWQLIAL